MTIATPSALATCLDDARRLLPTIRENAAEAERQGRMTDAMIAAFRSTILPRMMVTTELGGGGMPLPAQLRVVSVLSSGDGATGWSLAFATGSPLFGNLLEKPTYDAIYSNPLGGIAGALAPFSVSAEAVPGGYFVSGRSSYNSAHRLASHLFFGGIVRRDGQVTMTDGTPELRGFVVPKSQARIIPNWPVSAMIATESDDAEIERTFVAEAYSFPFIGASSSWRGEVERRIPLLSLLGPGLAAQSIGIARGALDAFRDMAMTKVPAQSRTRLADVPGAQLALAEAEGLWMAADALLFRTIDDTWTKAELGEPFEIEDAARLRLACLTTTRLSRRAIDTIRDHAGMNVVLRRSPLERFTRDMGAVTQHVAVAASRFDPIGKVLMGLPPGTPAL